VPRFLAVVLEHGSSQPERERADLGGMTNPITSGPQVIHRFDADGVGRCEAFAGDELRSELEDPRKIRQTTASAVCLGGAVSTLAMSSVGGPVGGLVAALAAGVECGLLVDDVITCYEKP
jgi:hypothetical protein